MQAVRDNNPITDWDNFEIAIIALYITSESFPKFTFYLHKQSEDITLVCTDDIETLTHITTDKTSVYRFFCLDHSLRTSSRYSVTLFLGH